MLSTLRSITNAMPQDFSEGKALRNHSVVVKVGYHSVRQLNRPVHRFITNTDKTKCACN